MSSRPTLSLHWSWRIAALVVVLVMLTTIAPAALPAVSAEGLEYIPMVTAPVIPADTVANAALPPVPRPEGPPAPVDDQPAPTPAASVAVALPASPPAPVIVPDEPTPTVTTVAVADSSMPTPAPVAVDDTPVPTPAAVAVGVPKRIRIASAGIDANVELVGLENDGSVGTPKNFDNTGWYEPGPRPGEPGNAVMVGHVDSAVLKRGAVFWNLRLVKPGDDITVTSDDGVAHHFTVTGQQQYNPQNVPVEQIFGQADGVHLNLITCDSTTPFNRRTGEYGGWLLVTADATP